MTISAKTAATAVAIILAASQWSMAKEGQESPHWSEDTCQSCHVDAAPVAGSISLTAGSAEELCETCHGDRGDARPCRHAANIPAGDLGVPEIFRASLKDGQVVCSTCHDIVYQCEHARPHFSFQNRGFLRDRTSRDVGDYCFKCHDSSAYEKLNPHDGITGMPPKLTCLLCHERLPETSAVGGIELHFNMRHDMNDTCRGCHKVRPHPGIAFGGKQVGWEHLAKPSVAVLEKKRQTEEKTGIVLPLSPYNGEVMCSTCHDQHGFDSGNDTEQSPKHRLRMDNICQACHDE